MAVNGESVGRVTSNVDQAEAVTVIKETLSGPGSKDICQITNRVPAVTVITARSDVGPSLKRPRPLIRVESAVLGSIIRLVQHTICEMKRLTGI